MTSAYRHAVCSKDDLVITGGTYVVNVVEDALRAHADKNSSVFAYDSSILKKVAAGTKGSKR